MPDAPHSNGPAVPVPGQATDAAFRQLDAVAAQLRTPPAQARIWLGQWLGQLAEAVHTCIGPHPWLGGIEPGVVTAVDPTTHRCTLQTGERPEPFVGVEYFPVTRPPQVGAEYGMRTAVALGQATGAADASKLQVLPAEVRRRWIVVPGASRYVLYYIDTDHYLCRVDWPPTDTAPYWTGYQRGTAPVPGSAYTDTVIGVLDGGATVVVGDRLAPFGSWPARHYGLAATDLTTVQWGPRDWSMPKVWQKPGEPDPLAHGSGVASPDGGLAGLWSPVDQPISDPAVHPLVTPWTSADGETAVAAGPNIDLGTATGSGYPQTSPWWWWYFQAAGAWLTPAGQRFACWLWHRTDETDPAAITDANSDGQPMHWTLMTSEAGAAPARQVLPKESAPSNFGCRIDFGPAGGLGYDPDTATLYVYANFGMDSCLPGGSNFYGHVEVGAFQRSGAGAAWEQVGAWRNTAPAEMEQLWVVSDNGLHAWAQRGYWQFVAPVDYWTADAGEHWQAFPPALPPGCPRPGNGDSLRTRHSINRAPEAA